MNLVVDKRNDTILDGRTRSAAVAAELRRAARKSRAPISFVSGGGGFRARKGDKWFLWGVISSLIIVFAIPFIVASIYFGVVASDQYAVELQFSLRSGESSVLDSLSGIAGLAASQQNLDSQIIVNYITSRAMVEKLDRAMDLRRIFSRPDVDWWSRFSPKRTIEDLEKYWIGRVDVAIDQQTSIINVRVRTFNAQDSLEIGKNIVAFSEELVNEMTRRPRESALEAARQELDRAQGRLKDATTAMRDLRNSEGVIDAETSAKAIEKVIEPIQFMLSKVQQQIAVTGRSMAQDTPQMKILNAQADNLRSQIASMQSQIAGTNETPRRTLADQLGKLSTQSLILKTAQQQYANAAVQFESARMEMETQHSYLVNFIPPSLPQKALYPKRWWSWSLIVFPAALLWSIIFGLGHLVRDHMAG